MKAGLFIASFLLGVILPKSAKEERAFQIDCPGFTIIVAPADGHTSLARAHDLAEFLGADQSQVCTLSIIALKRPEEKQ